MQESAEPFSFAAAGEFLNRREDLARMEDWWAGRDRNALALYGRRRVGKSWLFRAFADGKPALVLVAERRAEGAQLSRFGARLEPLLGFRPELPDVPALIASLYALAERERTLVVIDEFPYLLPARAERRDEVLTAIQAIMEERDGSKLKLVLCGSHIGQMTTLLANSSPLRGRLTPLAIEPLRFAAAQAFAGELTARERIERYAVTGGMSLYLDELARGGESLRARVCARVLDHRGPLFNDPRERLEEDLRQPGVYFSLLEELSARARTLGDLAAAIGKRTSDLGPYLETLREMQLVERLAPVSAGRDTRDHRYRIGDQFLRFWFRFVFDVQEDLRTGLRPRDLYDGEIAPLLADHVAPVFEQLCREWVRQQLGDRASRVGAWWGSALHELRRSGQRQREEIDVVGLRGGAVTVVGECKWTNAALSTKVLSELERFKLPALAQAGVASTPDGPAIVLFSRAGFRPALVEHATRRSDLRLVGVDELVSDLLATARPAA